MTASLYQRTSCVTGNRFLREPTSICRVSRVCTRTRAAQDLILSDMESRPCQIRFCSGSAPKPGGDLLVETCHRFAPDFFQLPQAGLLKLLSLALAQLLLALGEHFEKRFDL